MKFFVSKFLIAAIIVLTSFTYAVGMEKESVVSYINISSFPTEVPAGEAVLIKLRSPKEMGSAKGSCYGKEIFFFKKGDDKSAFYAIIGTNINQEENYTKLEVAVTYNDGATENLSFDIKIKRVEYPQEALTLPENMVEPPKEAQERIKMEQELVTNAYSKTTPTPQFESPFSLPLNTEFSSNFGNRRILNGTPKAPHMGIDMRGNIGKVVKASNNGAIVFVKDLYFTGQTALIDHGAGIFTAYFHLNKIYKNENDVVKKGEAIGEVGMTGRATGPHLHFGTKLNGFYVNPASVIALTEKLFSKETPEN